MSNRINENKMLLESYQGSPKKEMAQICNQKSLMDNQIANLIEESNSDKINDALYSFTFRDPTKRPKSTSYTDWRGQISRPNTGKKSKYFFSSDLYFLTVEVFFKH